MLLAHNSLMQSVLGNVALLSELLVFGHDSRTQEESNVQETPIGDVLKVTDIYEVPGCFPERFYAEDCA